jgi:hypothetical protein
MYLLARHMYNEKIAAFTFLVLIIGFPIPLTYGRQAIGEPAMLFYLLAGMYAFWKYLEHRSRLVFIASILLWGAALTSKQQTLPFWLLSIAALVMIAALQRDGFTLWSGISALAGTLLLWRGMLALQAGLEVDLPLYGAPMKGLIFVTGWVPVWELRLKALIAIGLLAMPTCFGLAGALAQEARALKNTSDNAPLRYIRVVYWVLTASWLIWFASLAMYWTRYLYPVTFIGSVFTGFFIATLTSGLKASDIVNHIFDIPRKLHITPDIIKTFFLILVLAYMGIIFRINVNDMVAEKEAETIADYLNQSTSPDAVIETYDSELLFLVQRRFHYPPDQVQVELNRRKYLDPAVEIAYNPEEANPDYIVVGLYGRIWKLYDPVLAQQDTWQLVFETPTYEIYKRLR